VSLLSLIIPGAGEFNAKGLIATVEADAFAQRTAAVEFAVAITEVTNRTEEQVAIEALRGLKGLLKSIEGVRVELKAPILSAGTSIDTTAKTFTAPMVIEANRLQGLLNEFAMAGVVEARKLEEERKKELQRIERERLAAEAEIRKQAAIAAKAANNPVEAIQIQAHAEAKVEAANVAAEAAVVAPVLAAKPAEASIQQPWTFEVLDVTALLAARPELVKVEVKRAEVLSELRAGVRELAGLRIFQETKVSVR